MADNYLEKKMEELRSGRLRNGATTPASGGPRKGYVSFRMPPRRVLVVGGTEEPLRSVCRSFVKAECKVAVAGGNRQAGEEMALKEGVRYFPLEPSDDNLAVVFSEVVRSWRDVDVILSPTGEIGLLASLWVAHKQRYPIPSDYGGRMIVYGNDKVDGEEEVMKALEEWHITFNRISISEDGDGGEAFGAAVIFLSLPKSGDISGSIINIG